MVVTIPFKLAANNVLLLKYFNKGRFLAASRHRCSKIVSSFQNYNLNMQSSTPENWAPCACTFDLASAGVLEMTDRVYCEQDMRDFSQKYFKINKIFKPSHKVYKNVKYCKQDMIRQIYTILWQRQTDLCHAVLWVLSYWLLVESTISALKIRSIVFSICKKMEQTVDDQ